MSDTQDVEALVARLDEVSCDPDLSTRQRADIDEAATALRTLARERDEANAAREGYYATATLLIGKAESRASSLEAQLAGAKEGLGRAVDDIEHWGSYAREFFQQKHDLAGDIARARAAYEALASAPASAGVARRVRHKKRGTTYEVLGEAQIIALTPLAGDEVVIVYRSLDDGEINGMHTPRKGDLWARRREDFEDGRFEDITTTPEASHDR